MAETSLTQTDFPITLGGKEYMLTFPIQAVWALEDATGQKMLDDTRTKNEIMAEYESMPRRQQMQRVVDMLWAGLITRQPKITREEVGSMVFLRDLTWIQAKVIEAFNASISDGTLQPPDEGSGPLAPTERLI